MAHDHPPEGHSGHHHGYGSGVVGRSGIRRSLHALTFTPVHASTLRILAPHSGERILDAGAGPGVLARRIARSGARVVCLEPDEQSLEVARSKLSGACFEFIAAPAERIPLPEASVDAAVASFTAHHWEDRAAGFAEIARVVKPGGRFVLAEFRPSTHVLGLGRRLAGSPRTNAPGFDSWRRELLQAGFSDVVGRSSGWATPFGLFALASR